MKKVFIIASALVLVLAGCSTTPIIQTSVVTDTVVKTVQSVPTTVVTTMTVVKVIDPISGNEYTINQGEVGVANADARATGYYDGYAAHWNGLVLNGDDTANQFTISVTPYTNDFITTAVLDVANWVTITNSNLVDGVLTVQPMSVGTLYITLNVPVGTQLPSEWAFTVNVVNATGGNVLTGDSIRWIVDMQQPS